MGRHPSIKMTPSIFVENEKTCEAWLSSTCGKPGSRAFRCGAQKAMKETSAKMRRFPKGIVLIASENLKMPDPVVDFYKNDRPAGNSPGRGELKCEILSSRVNCNDHSGGISRISGNQDSKLLGSRLPGGEFYSGFKAGERHPEICQHRIGKV